MAIYTLCPGGASTEERAMQVERSFSGTEIRNWLADGIHKLDDAAEEDRLAALRLQLIDDICPGTQSSKKFSTTPIASAVVIVILTLGMCFSVLR